ncbi:hypothetical protein [Pseudomonas sp. GL-R-26]|uniref:hypothetical protein n=1 Tax=Pseudomonas sp. GL-R-26 TaxID=2832392 RepID=UPI001CBF916D|nr:hypothetical protein [Pseudomonas sp. GL-R-26]
MAGQGAEKRSFTTTGAAQSLYEKPRVAQGFVKLEVTRGDGAPVSMETNWIGFGMGETSFSLEAYFGEDTGHLVETVGLMTIIKVAKGSYEIRDPFGDKPYKVAALFGKGRPDENLQGDNFGQGKLIVLDVVDESARKYIKGKFEFFFLDRNKVMVKVEAKEFSAEYGS